MKKSIKIILGFIILLIGIVILLFVYKAHFSKNTLIEIYKKDNEYKVYLKSDTNKEIVGYKLYKTFGIDINENESIVGFDLNITNNKLNGVIINYEENVENYNAYKDLNDYYHNINCYEDTCFLKYDSYYNLEQNENLFKNLKVEFGSWNEDYLVQNGEAGQWYYNHQIIINIKEEKIIISDIGDGATSNIYFLINEGKKYIYVDYEPMSTLSDRLYDLNGNLLSEKIASGNLKFQCTEKEYCPTNEYTVVSGTLKYIEFEFDTDTFSTLENYGKATVKGYPIIEKIRENLYADSYEYVYFIILESSSPNFLTYIDNHQGNTFISNRVIGLGCLENSMLNYYNYSDEFGMKSFLLTKDETSKIMNSTKENPIKLELEKLKLTGGAGAPTCYSHITNIKVIE